MRPVLLAAVAAAQIPAHVLRAAATARRETGAATRAAAEGGEAVARAAAGARSDLAAIDAFGSVAVAAAAPRRNATGAYSREPGR